MKDLTEVLNAAKAMLEEIELQPSGYDYRPYYAFRNRSQLNDPDAAVIRLKKAVAASHAHDGDAARIREAPMIDLRFYIDHGVIHDRVTSKHVVTDGEWPFEDTVEMVCTLLNSLTGLEALREIDGEAPAGKPSDCPTVSVFHRGDEAYGEDREILNEVFQEGANFGRWQMAEIARSALSVSRPHSNTPSTGE